MGSHVKGTNMVPKYRAELSHPLRHYFLGCYRICDFRCIQERWPFGYSAATDGSLSSYPAGYRAKNFEKDPAYHRTQQYID